MPDNLPDDLVGSSEAISTLSSLGLSVSKQTLYRWGKRGLLTRYGSLSGRYLWSRAQLLKMVQVIPDQPDSQLSPAVAQAS